LLGGADGLAATVGLVICLTLAWMAWLTQDFAVVAATVALAGALAGFLRYNFPPATIFLGDSGSVLIGLVIGAVAIKGSFKGPATAALVAPIATLAGPIFDGVAAGGSPPPSRRPLLSPPPRPPPPSPPPPRPRP